MRPLLIRFAFALGTLLVVQELLARAVYPLPEVLNFDRATYSNIDTALGRHQSINLAHASFTWASDLDDFEFVHRLNLYGFRDETWPLSKRAGETRIAFVGDSFVEGFSAAEEHTIPRVFSDLSAALGRPVETLNLGVGGGNLLSYAWLMRDALPLFHPDAVVLVIFANDVISRRLPRDLMEGALEPQRSSALEPRLLTVKRRLAAGQRAPRRWIGPPFEYMPKVPDPRYPWSDDRRAEALAFVEPDIARAARNGRFNTILTEVMPWFAKTLPQRIDLSPWLRVFRDYARAHGATLGVVYVPSRMQVSDRYLPTIARFSPPGSAVSFLGPEYQRHAHELKWACSALGLPFLDLTPELREREEETALYWSYDDHMRPEGYRFAAERIHTWWQDGWSDQPPGPSPP